MNIFTHFRNILFTDIESIYPKTIESDDVKVEFPNNPEYGDLSSNIGIIIAKKIKANPKDIAEKILKVISKNEYIDEVTIAGAGFLNIKVKKSFWYLFLKQLVNSDHDYPKINIGKGEKVNIEFVSSNPTGPLHLGHAKGAVFGDAIANLLLKCGYDITKEFYINDAGNQINNLTKSLKIRYKQLLGEKIELEENCYPGEYLIELAKNLHEEIRDDTNKLNDENFLNNFAVEKILKIIKNELHHLGVYHDNFVSEKQLILQNKVKHCIDFLKERNLLYQGTLEKPKGESSDDWEPKEQTLFRSTNYGDDIDRAVVKSNGEYTYFASDIAYHLDKIERGFNNMVLLLGADHIGYKKRLVSSVSALSDGKAKLDVKICQLVKLLRDGKQIKMSKRSGNFISLEEILDEIGKDALRFAILSKSSDTVLEIDVEKLKQQNKDNPVFYVQYASARANSILKKAKEMQINIENLVKEEVDLSLLDSEYDFNLIKMLALYPKILTSCLNTLDPHKITYYLYDLACKFHQIWSKGTKEENIKFINKDNVELTKARILLVHATTLVITSGLKILGIKAVEQM
jgi:arginyl-tRNA synthetase